MCQVKMFSQNSSSFLERHGLLQSVSDEEIIPGDGEKEEDTKALVTSRLIDHIFESIRSSLSSSPPLLHSISENSLEN